MAASIKEFTSSGLLSPGRGDGFVFGVLKRNEETGKVELDVQRNRELVALATASTTTSRSSNSEGEGGLGFKCVLHRAVDDLLTGDGAEVEVGRVMEEVRKCGFDGVLTSGGRGRAVDNIGRLKDVVDSAGREGVEVIVGGGLRWENLRGLVDGLSGENGLEGGVWFHSSCLDNEGRFDQEEAQGLAEEMRNMKGLLS
jgi:copper homeostasis protein CutC